MSRTFCFQFHNAFAVHLSPHQFGVAIKGAYEVVVHKIWASLNVHLDWVVLQVDIVNAFNNVFHKIIFQELRATSGQLFQFIHFIYSFYAFEFPFSLVTIRLKASYLLFSPTLVFVKGILWVVFFLL